jgi:hypothetical protein
MGKYTLPMNVKMKYLHDGVKRHCLWDTKMQYMFKNLKSKLFMGGAKCIPKLLLMGKSKSKIHISNMEHF